MPIHLRISLCMLIAREKKKKRTREKERGRKNRQISPTPSSRFITFSLRKTMATQMSITCHLEDDDPSEIYSLCRYRVPLSGNASLCHCTSCTRIALYSAQFPPHASPNSRNDPICHRFFCNYEMH